MPDLIAARARRAGRAVTMRGEVAGRRWEVIAVPGYGAGTFPAVDPDEMAFAMALFMGVGSGQIASSLRSGSEGCLSCECGGVLRMLSRGMGEEDKGRTNDPCKEKTLDEAFAALWHHYVDDERRLSLCARVLGFYFLAQKNGGRILERWVSESPDVADDVVLHPALVEAVAVVPLKDDGGLSERVFFEMVESIAGESA